VSGIGRDVEGESFDDGVETWPLTGVSKAGPDNIDFISGGSVETVAVGFAVGWTNIALGGGTSTRTGIFFRVRVTTKSKGA
jgi:hypothetical protein